ncbi:hypothetical protein DID75_01465 [Candidatus Marinamargulisbacteria bacterium SCGC AG-410-N11]|nr:hypothetical protein DID75_01465 [Candidatus Marinamargulisbacteria bacterium SCGC AG-410-N11]
MKNKIKIINYMILAIVVNCIFSCTSAKVLENDSILFGRGDLSDVKVYDEIDQSSVEIGIKEFEFTSKMNIPFTANYSVRPISIEYYTVGPKNQSVKVSASVSIPKDVKAALPIVVINPGTRYLKSEDSNYSSRTLYASSGYIAVSPHYIGYGVSGIPHPYLHAKTLAFTVIDMIRATKQLMIEKNILHNGQIFMTGYSEGGYATMAAAKVIEESLGHEIQLTAIAPNAGSFDMSSLVQTILNSSMIYPHPAAIPFLVFSYNDIYDLENQVGPILRADVKKIKPMYNGQYTRTEINRQLPDVPVMMFTESFVQKVRGGEVGLVTAVLKENDVYRWTPKVKVRMHHCISDIEVSYQHSKTALNYFHSNGANHVELIDPMPNANHLDGYYVAQIETKKWFDMLVKR